MGLYIGPRWLGIRITKRGVRASAGPRIFRVHTGAGGSGISTGAGPVSYYQPLRRRKGGRRGRAYHGTLPGWTCPHNHSRPDLAEACAQRHARTAEYQAYQAARQARQAASQERAAQRQAASQERAAQRQAASQERQAANQERAKQRRAARQERAARRIARWGRFPRWIPAAFVLAVVLTWAVGTWNLTAIALLPLLPLVAALTGGIRYLVRGLRNRPGDGDGAS